MREKLGSMLKMFDDINRKLMDPEIINNQPQMIKLSKERTHMEPIVEEIKKIPSTF